MSGARKMARPADGPHCRGRKPPSGQAIVTGIGGDGLRLAPCSHRARPTGTGGGPPGYRRRSPSWKNARFPRGSGNPYGAIGERGFPPLGYRSPARPVRCGRGRAVLTALRLENGLHHRKTVGTRRECRLTETDCSPAHRRVVGSKDRTRSRRRASANRVGSESMNRFHRLFPPLTMAAGPNRRNAIPRGPTD